LKYLFFLILFIPNLAFSATRYQVVQKDGSWWFQAPDGHRFLSLGVDCVNPGGKDDKDPGRPQYRSQDDGLSYLQWQDQTLGRLKQWGFNTFGGWCDTRLLKTDLPMTPVLHIQAALGSIWIDMWDENYEAKVQAKVRDFIQPYLNQPQVLGYFLDNEFGWGDDYLLSIALAWDAKSGGKKKVVQTLKNFYQEKYPSFLRDFDTKAKSWEELMQAKDAVRRPGRGRHAQDAWTYETARRYYTVVSAAVRKADPGALILGDRFRQYYPQAVARAAKGILDVISTNYEATTTDGWVSPSYFQTLHELSGLPVMIGEFYTAARQNRSGNRNHGGEFTLVDTQEQRAKAMQAQVRQFASMPFVIGWHWFQYTDEPTFGRDDGEDYNMGLVDIYNRPYDGFAAAFSKANAGVNSVHLPKVQQVQAGPLVVSKQEKLVADGKLGDWDKRSPVPRALLHGLQGVVPFGDVFLAWDAQDLRLAVRAYSFSYPEKDAVKPDDQRTWGETDRLWLRTGGYKFYGCTRLVDDPENKAGRTVLYTLPPKPGHVQAAVSTSVDAWNYVWELAIPASELGKRKLKPGDRFLLDLVIGNRGDFESMQVGGAKGLEVVLR
jgi:hypothetical protein